DYVRAAALADRLFSEARAVTGLHGDLHHENIMLADRGWVVIDPVGLVGEAGFGAANLFYDPADRDDLCLDPRRVAYMADALSYSLRMDPRRLLDQAYAYGCLSAAWNAGADASDDEARDLSIAAVVRRVRDAVF
ncbi:aminoglycoside phosphotransferase family protein, partial [Rhizobiaceae sp. 2RAB30]